MYGWIGKCRKNNYAKLTFNGGSFIYGTYSWIERQDCKKRWSDYESMNKQRLKDLGYWRISLI